MSDTPGPFTPPRHELIDFHGDQLIAVVLEGDGVAIPLRLLCEPIGLDTEAQAERLRNHAVLAAGLRVVNVEIGGRVRSVMAIIHTKLPFWLATISPEQVNDETRPKLILYQTELADILARLFYGEPASPTPLSADPTIAALQQQFHAALSEMRRIRETIIDEQQRTNRAVADTQQRLTSLTEIVAELRTFLPVSPKQAEYIQRAIKRLATRLHKKRQASEAGYGQTEITSISCCSGNLRSRCISHAMMPCRSISTTLQLRGSSARPQSCCPATPTPSHLDKKHSYE